MAYDSGRLKLFSGSANPALARAIAQHIGVPLGDLELGRFANGEVRVSVNESVRGADVFVIQPTCHPPNDTLMELLVLLDALKRASAWRVNAVVPFYGYARQDRKTRPREPITAKLVANLLTVAGADRVVTMDLHAGQIQGFFDVPVDHLTAVPLLAEYFARKRLDQPVVVSPDHGGVSRARELADRLGVPIAIIDKRRPEPGVAEVMSVVGEVEGRTAIMIDDIIDSGGTIRHGAEALIALGARAVYACCTHAVFSGTALQKLAEAPIEEIVVTDTIPLPPGAEKARVKVLSVAPILGEAIVRIHEDLSVSRLFT